MGAESACGRAAARWCPLRSGGDAGTPIVLDSPESPAAQQIQAVADKLAIRSDSLVGKNLNLGVN